MSSFSELIRTSSSFRIWSCSHKRLSWTCRGRQSFSRSSTRARARARPTHVHVALCHLDGLRRLLGRLTCHLQTEGRGQRSKVRLEVKVARRRWKRSGSMPSSRIAMETGLGGGMVGPVEATHMQPEPRARPRRRTRWAYVEDGPSRAAQQRTVNGHDHGFESAHLRQSSRRRELPLDTPTAGRSTQGRYTQGRPSVVDGPQLWTGLSGTTGLQSPHQLGTSKTPARRR